MVRGPASVLFFHTDPLSFQKPRSADLRGPVLEQSRARQPRCGAPPPFPTTPAPRKLSVNFYGRGGSVETRVCRCSGGDEPPCESVTWRRPSRTPRIQSQTQRPTGSRWAAAAFAQENSLPRAPRTLTVVLRRLEIRVGAGVGAGAGVGRARLGRLHPRQQGRAGQWERRQGDSFSPRGTSGR